jgi:hypothetical protein
MSPTAVRQSIEALFQEAEAVVHDGAPMLAIIKSFPPTSDDQDDQANQPDTGLKLVAANPQDAAFKAPKKSDDSEAPAKPPRRFGRVADSKPEDSEKDIKPVPAEPPAPTKGASARDFDAEDLDQLVEDAKADIDATVPEDISVVMADIAAAVGVVPPAEDHITETPEAISEPVADLADADKPEDQEEEKSPFINDQLAAFVGDTVRTVLNAELPSMVHSAVKDALETLVVTKKESPVRKKTAAKKTTKKTAAKTGAKPCSVTGHNQLVIYR